MKHKAFICFLLIISLLLSFPAFAKNELSEAENSEEITMETQTEKTTETTVGQPHTEQTATIDKITGEETITIEPIDGSLDGEVALMGTFDDPREAFLKVNTNCYGAPCPTDGYLLQTVSANTRVWVVEKKYCSHNDRYYYYAGYNYNGESHRGYFCEDNVYLTASTRLTPANVDAEKSPANYKVHTSKAGTVYDGPADTYSTMGSVGVESIKLIRTDGDYNFIEYTVTGTGKVKRGYLHYSYITDVWSSLTAQAASKLNGKTFYLKNTATGQYMQAATNEVIKDNRMIQTTFTGNTHQIFKFVYYGSGTQKYFRIIPANCYSETNPFWLTTQSIASQPHPDRKAMIYPDRPNKTYQRYWVVKREGTANCYKIVPVSSYGTMTLTNRPSGSTYNVNQYYTNTETDDIAADIWQLQDTKVTTSAKKLPIPAEEVQNGFCWIACARMMASAATTSLYDISLTDLAIAIKGHSNYNKGGSVQDSAKAANCYMGTSIDSNFYAGIFNKKYSEPALRNLIMNGLPVISSQRETAANDDIPDSQQGNVYKHQIIIVGFEWNDALQSYYYTVYDPYYAETIWERSFHYSTLTSSFGGVNPMNSHFTCWQNTAVRNVWYINDGLLPPDEF